MAETISSEHDHTAGREAARTPAEAAPPVGALSSMAAGAGNAAFSAFTSTSTQIGRPLERPVTGGSSAELGRPDPTMAALARTVSQRAILRNGATKAPPSGAQDKSKGKAEQPGPPFRLDIKGDSVQVGLNEPLKKKCRVKWAPNDGKGWNKGFQSQIAPGMVGNFELGANAFIDTGVDLNGGWQRVDAYGPTAKPKVDEIKITGAMDLKAGVEGYVKLGAGLGAANLANITGNLKATLSAEGDQKVSLGPTIRRYCDPEKGEFDPWEIGGGSIDFTVEMGYAVKAKGSVTVDYKLLFTDGTFGEWTIGEATVAKGRVKCIANFPLDGGAATTRIEMGEPDSIGLPEPSLKRESEKPPPYRRDGGAEGAGPASEEPPEEGQGGAGGAPR